jgi:cupin superfamily acireductone dioxygenase involved in methionine salvage
MKQPICEFCGEYTKCTCTFQECAICKKSYSNYDPDEKHSIYEYRGFLACNEHFDELIKKVDYKRSDVIETVKKTTESQRNGEFKNNYQKYNIHNVANDGLPIMPIKEPQILKDYENGIL